MTKALDFITEDIGKAKGQFGKAALISATILMFSVAVALGFRHDVEDIDAFYVAQSTLLGAILFAYVVLFLSSSLSARKRRVLWQSTVVVSLLLSLGHQGLQGFSQQASLIRFWKSAAFCFAEGVIVGLICGTILTIGAFKLLPMPDRRWQIGIAAAASLGGLMTLNLACPSTVATHIVVGHWAQGLLVTAIVAKWQDALFRRKMRDLLGPAGARSGAIDSLED